MSPAHRLTYSEKEALSLFGRWVVDYAARHGLSITRLANRASLAEEILLRHCRPKASRGHRSVRPPNVKTCLALAVETNTPLPDILALITDVPDEVAGNGRPTLEAEGATLVDLYQSLPRPLKQALLDSARALERSALTGDG